MDVHEALLDITGRFIIVGGTVLELHGIRRADDLDVLVNAMTWDALAWPIVGECKRCRGVEVFTTWNAGSFTPTLDELLTRATVVDDVPYASLDDVARWKAARGRAKDLADLDLIRAAALLDQ